MAIIALFRPEQRAESAQIKTSACRGYIVELDPGIGAAPRMLEDLAGNVVHFRSIERARDALRRRGVRHARLVQHHACEELGAPEDAPHPETGVAVLKEEG